MSKKDLLKILDDYNSYEYDKMIDSVKAGAPQPTTHPFTLVGLFNWLELEGVE